ncbi:MAG: PQQ-dependent sugar dehydrogenase [Ancrocorticia sp.]|uniref:PQQ-dependent sugar dehydrogenase n=1 Tax=Ancrocorticia sp. TaxID=2593684 RepID=UPI003F90F9ED
MAMPHRPRTTASLSALLLAAALSACTSETSETRSGPETTSGAVTELATDLNAPWSVAFYEESALISERDTGTILEFSDSNSGSDTGELREVGVIDGVQHGGEGGLLGLATHDSQLFVYFTGPDGNRIDRFDIDGQAGALQISNQETVLDGLPSSGNHNGGRIAFGPDDMLYATVGDAGEGPSAQELDSYGGKILRMTPEGEPPEDNPFSDSLVYSYGHRNPQGIGWDAEGTMYSTEFGQNTWDELNVIEPGGNYGWPAFEGIGGADYGNYIDPVQQWSTSEASPSGIAVTADSIVIANLRGERLRQIPLDDLSESTEYFVAEHGRLRDAIVAPDESLWILTNNTDGRGQPGDGDDKILRVDLDVAEVGAP